MSVAARGFVTDSGSRGYGLVFEHWGTTTVCTVAVDPAGMVEAAFGLYSKEDAPDAGHVHRERRIRPHEDASWALQMFQGLAGERLLDKLRVPVAGREIHRGAISSAMLARAQEICDLPDAEALAAVEKSQTRSLRSVNFYSGKTERAIRRRQAAVRYPILADLLPANVSCKTRIDTSQGDEGAVLKLLSGLASCEVEKPALNRLRKVPAIPDGCSLASVTRLAATVPEWIPSDPDEWRAFCHIAEALVADLDAPEDLLAATVRQSKGRWQEFQQKIVKAGFASEDDPGRLDPNSGVGLAMTAAREMAQGFMNAVVLPIAAFAQSSSEIHLSAQARIAAREAAYRILFSGRSAFEISDMARRFGQERLAILAGDEHLSAVRAERVRNDLAKDEWPQMTRQVRAPNGIWIVPLQSFRELQEESRVLDHCVGRSDHYAAGARKCTLHLISFRSGDLDDSFERLSTAEMDGITSANDTIRVRQHYGLKNGTPSAAERDAMTWYLSEIEKGSIPLNWDQIQGFKAGTLVDMDDVEKACDYDWRERDQLYSAIGPWVRFFTKPYKVGFDELLETPEIQAVIEQFPPDFLLSPQA